MNQPTLFTDERELTKQEVAAQLLPLLAQFQALHEGDEGFMPGQMGYAALRTLIFNAQYEAEYGSP